MKRFILLMVTIVTVISWNSISLGNSDYVTLFSKASELVNNKKYNEAILILKAATNSSNPMVRFEVFRSIGDVYYLFLKDYDRALENYNNAMKINTFDPVVADRISEIYFNYKKDNEKAIQYARWAEINGSKIWATYYNIACYHSLRNFMSFSDLDKALQYLYFALYLGYKDYTYIKNDKDFANLQTTKGFQRFIKNHQYIDDALKLQSDADKEMRAVQQLLSKNDSDNKNNKKKIEEKYTSALKKYRSSLKLLNRIAGNVKSVFSGFLYARIAGVYQSNHQYEMAYKYLVKSYKVFQSIFGKNHYIISDVYCNLGDLFRNRLPDSKSKDNVKEYNDGYKNLAIKYYRKSEEVIKNNGIQYHPKLIELYMKIGDVYKNRREYDRSLKYLLMALENCDKVYLKGFYDINIAGTHNRLGDIYKIQHDYASSIQHHEIADQMYADLIASKKNWQEMEPLIEERIKINLALSNSFFSLLDYDQSFNCARKAEELIYKPDHKYNDQMYRSLGYLYSQKNEPLKALEYFSKIDFKNYDYKFYNDFIYSAYALSDLNRHDIVIKILKKINDWSDNGLLHIRPLDRYLINLQLIFSYSKINSQLLLPLYINKLNMNFNSEYSPNPYFYKRSLQYLNYLKKIKIEPGYLFEIYINQFLYLLKKDSINDKQDAYSHLVKIEEIYKSNEHINDLELKWQYFQTLHQKGNYMQRNLRFNEAVKIYEKAQSYDVLNKFSTNRMIDNKTYNDIKIDTWVQLSICYSMIGNSEKAFSCLADGKKYIERNKINETKDSSRIIDYYNHYFNFLYKDGKYRDILDNIEKVSISNISKFKNLAKTYIAMGRYSESVSNIINLFVEVNKPNAINRNDDLTYVHEILSYYYSQKGDYEQSIRFRKKIISYLTQKIDPDTGKAVNNLYEHQQAAGHLDSFQFHILNNNLIIADMYLTYMHDLEKADEHVTQCERYVNALHDRVSINKYTLIINIYKERIKAYKENNYENLIRYCESELNQKQKFYNDSVSLRVLYFNFGYGCEHSGNYSKAVSYYREALKHASFDNFNVNEISKRIVVSYIKDNKNDEALAYLDKHQNSGDNTSGKSLTPGEKDFIKLRILASGNKNDAYAVLFFSDLLKSRSHFYEISLRHAGHEVNAKEKEINRIIQLQNNINEHVFELDHLLGIIDDPDAVEAIRIGHESLDNAENEFQKSLDRIYGKYKDVNTVSFKDSFDYNGIQKKLGNNTAIISFVLAEFDDYKRLYCIVLTSESIKIIQLGNADGLDDTIISYHRLLSNINANYFVEGEADIYGEKTRTLFPLMSITKMEGIEKWEIGDTTVPFSGSLGRPELPSYLIIEDNNQKKIYSAGWRKSHVELNTYILTSLVDTGYTVSGKIEKQHEKYASTGLTWRAKEIKEQSGELYKILISPIAGQLHASINKLIIIPDGNLSYLPFDTLKTHGNSEKDIIQRSSISLYPSCMWYQTASVNSKTKKNESYFKCVGPDFNVPCDDALPGVKSISNNSNVGLNDFFESLTDYNDLASQYYKYNDITFRNLRYANLELADFKDEIIFRENDLLYYLDKLYDNIVSLFHIFDSYQYFYPFKSVRIVTGLDASEKMIKKFSGNGTLEKYNIIHISTHGVFLNSIPEYSSIAFSEAAVDREDPGNIGNNVTEQTGEDGLLTVHEARSLSLNAELVNLAACETALGKSGNGHGITGLTTSFLLAGSKRVAATLWKVSEEDTIEFNKDFYLGLDENDYVTSFMNAKKKLKKNNKTSDPYFWAPFVMYGM